ncbi:hypothetical protein BGX38DRAFT_1083350, partial [Terfezia claveryi]
KTKINRGQWKVPIPLEVTPDDVRQEILDFGGEYCWLNVLCMRQKKAGSAREQQQNSILLDLERQLDIPTIGLVY